MKKLILILCLVLFPSILNAAQLKSTIINGTLTMDGAVNESEGADIASATTTDIYGGDDGNTLHITGTTTIVDFTDASSVGQWRYIIFDGILTLTDGSGITLPGSSNITTAAGDYAFVYADAVDAFTVLYFKADGTTVVGGGGGATTALDNLASVAINESLVSDTANTDDLGTEAINWKQLYLGSGGISLEGSTDDGFQTTINVADPTSDNAITFQDSSHTVVGRDTTDTLENKTHTEPVLNDIKDSSEKVSTVAAAGATETLDYEVAHVHDITLDEACTFTFANAPVSGKGGWFTLIKRQDDPGGNATTWPASVDWPGGSAPTESETGTDTVYIYTFITVDGGTIWHGMLGSADSS